MSELDHHKLKIRIRVKQPQPLAIEEVFPEPAIHYEQVWDWKKIGVAVASLLGAVWLMIALITRDENQSVVQHGEQVAVQPAAAVSHPLPLVMAETTETTETMKVLPSSGGVQPKPVLSSDQTGTATRKMVIPAKKPTKRSTVNSPQLIEQSIPKTVIQAKPHLSSEQSTDHPEVLRAQLSHAIKAREPVDSIESVWLQTGESKPVYFYLHLKSMQGKKIRINWYHDDKLDSSLSLQVHNGNWRTQASKQMDDRRLGAWRVELMDESGSQLAIRNFTVSRQ